MSEGATVWVKYTTYENRRASVDDPWGETKIVPEKSGANALRLRGTECARDVLGRRGISSIDDPLRKRTVDIESVHTLP